MRAVDTNVLLRLFVADDLAQHKAATKRLSKLEAAGEKAFVSTVVVAELAWGLRAVYGYDRAAIATVIDALLDGDVFEVDDRAAVSNALAAYKQGGPELAVLVILSLGRSRGATSLLTFDRALLKYSDCEKP